VLNALHWRCFDSSFIEFGSKRSRRRGVGWNRCLPPLKCPNDCLGEKLSIEREKAETGRGRSWKSFMRLLAMPSFTIASNFSATTVSLG